MLAWCGPVFRDNIRHRSAVFAAWLAVFSRSMLFLAGLLFRPFVCCPFYVHSARCISQAKALTGEASA